ncbi:hypothetical protein D9613_003923 [Agrocybe pediades]|uniref:Uncharacterized protein n=1 Tax=Agrocybe pediades TaxID=84607 RepID=A0A8H4VIC3_9AGAR|nr:hypothetical protein D9613_003923 [Agrocybe pediades]
MIKIPPEFYAALSFKLFPAREHALLFTGLRDQFWPSCTITPIHGTVKYDTIRRYQPQQV